LQPNRHSIIKFANIHGLSIMYIANTSSTNALGQQQYCHQVLQAERRVKSVLYHANDSAECCVCSCFTGFSWETILVCGMPTVGRRNRMDKSPKIRARIKPLWMSDWYR